MAISSSRGMEEFGRIVQRDVLVRAYWSSWLKGDFASFEAMLLDLSVSLVKRSEEMAAKVLKFHQESGPVFLIDKENSSGEA